MRPTKFSGPVLYSGQAINSGSFSDMPIGFNPDYVSKWDDFLSKTIDVTNEYSFTAISSGTVEIWNRGPDRDFPSADSINGWGVIQSEPADPAALASGGILYTNEFVQPVRTRRPLLAEARVGISDPLNSTFFYGLNADGLEVGGRTRVGFELKSDGTGELEAVADVAGAAFDPVRVDTGIIMDPFSASAGAALGTALVLSVRFININALNTSGKEGTRAHFYVNRVPVATINQVSSASEIPFPISSAVMQPALYYRKDSEVTGMVIDDAMIADATDTGPFVVSGLPTKVDDDGEIVRAGEGGLYGGQIITIDSEDIRIDKLSILDVGTVTLTDVTRAVNSTSLGIHDAGDSIVAAVGGCFVDYTSTIQARYGGLPSNANYMVSPDPKG